MGDGLLGISGWALALVGVELRKQNPNPRACALVCPLLSPPQSLLDIFVEMEKRLILSEDNLDALKSICFRVKKSLLGRIEDYELSGRGS